MGTHFDQILEYISPTLVEQAKYIFSLGDNLEALINAIIELEGSSADVLTEVETQRRQGLQQLQDVRLWNERVEAIGPKVYLLFEASEDEFQRLCMNGYCSGNFGSTYRYGKKVSKNLKQVKFLLSTKPAAGTVTIRGLSPPIEKGPTQPTISLDNMLEATWSRLMEYKVGIWGLYGMGGVGKTALLKQINNRFLEKMDEFEVVISIVVSQNLQIERIQKEIGERLGLWVSDEQWDKKTKEEKVSDIDKVLTRQRFVVLLDDIWRKVELTDIGIPLLSPENKSKVVYTTRSKIVCGRMGLECGEKDVTGKK